jgi:glycerol-3-phosphate acyltransferase PlsX
MAGGMFKLGRLDGVERPALGTLLPAVEGAPALLIDTGANVDCPAEWLVQFARMGDIYMRQVMGVASPRVALLNIGEEAEKGNAQTKEAHLLLESSGLRFVGNVEGRDALSGGADVIVADGFAGNVLLKAMEGVSATLFRLMKQELTSSLRAKVGGLLTRSAFRRLRKNLDADEVGGAPLLGVRGAVVKAHGNSNAHAFFCAIRQARKMLEGDVVARIESETNKS